MPGTRNEISRGLPPAILFMERNDILDLFVVNNVPLPSKLSAESAARAINDEVPPF
jgi:hypothetical protein